MSQRGPGDALTVEIRLLSKLSFPVEFAGGSSKLVHYRLDAMKEY